METWNRGDASEAQVIAKLKELEQTVLIPFGDNERYDLVIDKEDDMVKVQVKTLYERKREGRISTKLRTQNARGNKRKYYEEGEVDAFALYYPENGKCYWVEFEDAPKTEITLALEYKQNQKNVRLAKDYLLSKRL